MNSTLQLRIEGPDVNQVIDMAAQERPLWLGRDESCDIVLASELVSRRHVCLTVRDELLHIQDRSANGTFVNGEHLRSDMRSLTEPAMLNIGPYTVLACVAPRPHAASSQPVEVSAALRRRIHHQLLERIDLHKLDRNRLAAADLRPQVETALRQICQSMQEHLPLHVSVEQLIADLCDEALGLGPLEKLLSDDSVTEIMVVDPSTIYAERKGRLTRVPLSFTDADSVRAVLERIVTPLGRRIDESSPLVDARLKDGSRVNAVIPPLATKGPCITIRKFSKSRISFEQLVEWGSMTAKAARLLRRAVQARKNIVISGGTGSGKTTLLNVLSTAIAEEERVVTVEDAAELQLAQTHVVTLESKPPNMEGRGEYTIRDLVRNALRMRPDRILVGECRGAEALDMLQAMNTGHDGSMTTTHANSPKEAIARLETLCLMAGLHLPDVAIRRQLSAAVDLIVQQTRFSDGSRRVTHITEICGTDDNGEVILHDIFRFHRSGTGTDGGVQGALLKTGYLPTFIGDLIAKGLIDNGEFL